MKAVDTRTAQLVRGTGAPRPEGGRGRFPVLLAAVCLICAGCLSVEEPSPSVTPKAETPGGTDILRNRNDLVIAVPADPQGFLPPANDDTTALLVQLLFDPLYRLDEQSRPQPNLAVALPQVSTDGLTWTIPLGNARFSNGDPVTASDAAFSLELAASPACPFGRDLCTTVSDNLVTASGKAAKSLSLTLQQPFSPLLAEVLAQLPVLDESVVRAATRELVGRASRIDAGQPGRTVQTITDATNKDACLSDVPPFGCKLSDYTGTLETLLTDAGVPLPTKDRFLGGTGALDMEAYGGALLDRVSALDQVLNGTGTDQLAGALPMLDPAAQPLGAGPYSLERYTPGVSIELKASTGGVAGTPSIAHITLRIVRDPATASTQLLSGDADWLLDVDPAQLAGLETSPGVGVGIRPVASQRTITFNVRSGRVYSDHAAREAFGMCLDRTALADQASGGRAALAMTPVSASSWAMQAPSPGGRDVAAALALLQNAGWVRGSDGIFAKNGQRLSSSVAVRPSRTDLVAFLNGAARQLHDCGIELQVQELDLTGDLLLSQLQWPNDFDTVLLARDLGPDPDHDLLPFEGAHATSADNPADANPGGYASSEADRLIHAARQETNLGARQALYGQLEAVLAADVPSWSIWYDTAASAISRRVLGAAGPLDPSAERFWWNAASWSLGAP